MQNTVKNSLFCIGKKALALALCLMMALSLLPATALAAEDELIQLATPTELEWGVQYLFDEPSDFPGFISWKIDGDTQGEIELVIYNSDGTIVSTSKGSSDEGYNNVPYFLLLEEQNSGTYYFTVQSLGDGTVYADSEIAKSEEWTYIKPEAQLDGISSLRPESTETVSFAWEIPENTEYIYGYEVEILFSETEDAEPHATGGHFSSGKNINNIEISSNHIKSPGYYYIRVRSISKDITMYQNSEWSEISEPYHVTDVVSPTLQEILEMSEHFDVRARVQSMDTQELKTAMLIDQTNEGAVELLSQIEESVGGQATVVVTDVDAFDESKVSIVGANLNTQNEARATLNIGKPKAEHVMDTMYHNAVAFSMDIDGVEDTSNLAVPVKITLPIPETINPDFLVLLHYHQNGDVEEVGSYRYKDANGQYFASFVITSFSDFVMAEESQEDEPTHDHVWGDGVVTKAANCAEEGEITYTCTICGETKTEAVPKTNDHVWDEGVVTTAPTCTEPGVKTYTCTICEETKTEVIEALGHDLEYSAKDGVITESCTRGDHTATATLTAENAVYTGEDIKNAQVVTSEDWSGGEVTVTYENNKNAGTATANITVEGVTATVNFEIAKATATITLGNLSQYTNNLGAVTATVEPKDETAVIVVEYGTDVAEVPCNHEHTEDCGKDGIDCAHVHDEECEYAAARTDWSTTAPTAAGTYKVRAQITKSDNLEISKEYTEGTLVITRYVAPSRPSTTTPVVTTPATPEPEPVNAAEVYNDVEETDWYIESVNYVVENGLMNGYDETTFAPNDNLSRAMLMTIIARIDGVDTEGGNTWYEAGMTWAVENGISDGSNPMVNITREQLVTMLYRYVGSPEVSGTLNFKDVSEISGYAVDAMTWAVQNGILKGTDVGTLNPQNSATRAEAAAILARFCESVKK